MRVLYPFALLLGLLAPAVAALEVRDVRLWRAPDHTRIVFDLSAPAEHKLIQLRKPDRIVVDLQDASFGANLEDLKLESTPVSRIRHAVREGDDLRFVFDLKTTVRPRSFVLKANDQRGDRLVLDLTMKLTRGLNPASGKVWPVPRGAIL